MKSLASAALILGLVLFVASPVSAGEVALFGSAMDGRSDPGWGGGGKLSVDLVRHLQLESRATWLADVSAHPFDNSVTAVPLDLGLALNLLPDHFFNPYLNGGASWAYLRPKHGGNSDDWGWYAGGGFKLAASEGLGFFLEVLYRRYESRFETADVFDTQKYQVKGASANAGLLWRW